MTPTRRADQLMKEGNAFEADAVTGVEGAENEEGREVHAREVRRMMYLKSTRVRTPSYTAALNSSISSMIPPCVRRIALAII